MKIYFTILYLFLTVPGLPCCKGFLWSWRSEAALWLRCSASPRSGSSCCGARTIGPSGSSCGLRARWPLGWWDPPGPGIKPTVPSLAGGLPTTGLQGGPIPVLVLLSFLLHIRISVFVRGECDGESQASEWPLQFGSLVASCFELEDRILVTKLFSKLWFMKHFVNLSIGLVKN